MIPYECEALEDSLTQGVLCLVGWYLFYRIFLNFTSMTDIQDDIEVAENNLHSLVRRTCLEESYVGI